MFNITGARSAAKSALEGLFEGTCVITGYTSEVNETTKETELAETIIYSGSCRLSQAKATSNQSAAENMVAYEALLFLPVGASASAGCGITVTQNGITCDFEQVGDPVKYSTHIEIKGKRVARA